MLEFTKFDTSHKKPDYTVTLPYELRQKSRQRIQLDNGEEAALILPRGTILHDNDHLMAEDGSVVEVKAADELLSVVNCTEPLLFARACYHLGNRHLPLQIEVNKLSYLHDHVLDDMMAGLGHKVYQEHGPFEPEEGAYGGSGHGGHSHNHHGGGHHHSHD